MIILLENWRYDLQLLWEFLVPRRCGVCGAKISEGLFCPVCREHFVLNKMMEEQGNLNIIYLLFRYERELRNFIRGAKFHGQRHYLYPLGEEAQLVLDNEWMTLWQQYDIVSCIPTSLDRAEQRGFEIPQEIFNFFPKDKMQQVLQRIRITAPLYNLDREQREQELAGCFKVVGNVSDKRILLLDDIFTTGSTAQEAAKTLLAAGAEYVDMMGFSAGKNNWDDN